MAINLTSERYRITSTPLNILLESNYVVRRDLSMTLAARAARSAPGRRDAPPPVGFAVRRLAEACMRRSAAPVPAVADRAGHEG